MFKAFEYLCGDAASLERGFQVSSPIFSERYGRFLFIMSSSRIQWPDTKGLLREGRVTRIASRCEGDEIYEMSHPPDTLHGTRADQYDMHVLGRQQQLNVKFTISYAF